MNILEGEAALIEMFCFLCEMGFIVKEKNLVSGKQILSFYSRPLFKNGSEVVFWLPTKVLKENFIEIDTLEEEEALSEMFCLPRQLGST